MAEWLKAADCKSARVSVRRFESFPFHQWFSGFQQVTSSPWATTGLPRKSLLALNHRIPSADRTSSATARASSGGRYSDGIHCPEAPRWRGELTA